MAREGIISQAVVVSDVLITELQDREYAERLTREAGIRRHFDISWSKMPYHTHYRDNNFGGEMWRFLNKPFRRHTTNLG